MEKKIRDIISTIENIYTNQKIDGNKFINDINFNQKENKVILELNKLGSDLQKNNLIQREVIKKLKIDLKINGVKIIYKEIEKANPYVTTTFDNVKVIAIVSGKGGVGKSEVAYNLAKFLAKENKVALVDTDIYGYSQALLTNTYGDLEQIDGFIQPLKTKDNFEIISPQYFIEKNENKAIVWRASMFNKLLTKFFKYTKYQDNLDYLIIDTPPGTGDILLNLNLYFKNLNYLLVTTPNKNSHHVAQRMIDVCQELNMNSLGIINNMAYYEQKNQKNYIFGTENIIQFAKDNKINFLGDIPFKSAEYSDSYLDEYYQKILNSLDI